MLACQLIIKLLEIEDHQGFPWGCHEAVHWGIADALQGGEAA